MIIKIQYGQEHLYRGVTPEQEADNQRMIAFMADHYNRREGIRVGDYVDMPAIGDYPAGLYRVAHDWGNSVQLTSYVTPNGGGAPYMGPYGSISYSGGLRAGIFKEELAPTGEFKLAEFWTFDRGNVQGHNGIYFELDVRIYRLEESK